MDSIGQLVLASLVLAASFGFALALQWGVLRALVRVVAPGVRREPVGPEKPR